MLLEIISQSALLILILLVLRPVFKKVLDARFRYVLWLLPALRLMVPYSIQSAMSIWNIVVLPALPAGLTTAGNSGMEQTLAGINVLPASATVITTSSQKAMQATAPSMDGLNAMNAALLNWIQLLSSIGMALGVLGSLAALTMMVINNIRIAHRLRRAERVLMDSKVPVLLADSFPSPCLIGLLRPCIAITTEVIKSKVLFDMVLRHEMMHYRRHDHLWTALRSVLLCLWWWNPLVWLAAYYSREDCETACDEAVINNMSLEDRQQYGMSLIALLRKTPSTRSLLLSTTAMQSSKRAMKERITMIANWKKKGRFATICIVLCVALLLPVLCTSAIGQGTEMTQAPETEDSSVLANNLHSTIEEVASIYGAYPIGDVATKDPFDDWPKEGYEKAISILNKVGVLPEETFHDTSSYGREELRDALNDVFPGMYSGFIPRLLQNIWGDSEYWSLEDKAWYTQLLTRHQLLTPYDRIYMLPDSSKQTVEEIRRVSAQ